MSKLTDTEMAENVRICEKLLGWTRSLKINNVQMWHEAPQGIYTPSFDTWAEAGLIMDALAKDRIPFDLYQDGKWDVVFYSKYVTHGMRASDTGPLAIRAAALEYIRRQNEQVNLG